MKTRLALLFLLPHLALILTGCKPHAPEAEKEAKKEAKKEEPHEPGVVTIKKEERAKMGLKVEPLIATNLPPEAMAYGQVLDPTPIITLVAELGPAGLAAETSKEEFARLQKLHAQDNASTRALQAAGLAAQRDLLLAQSLHTRAVLAWGKEIADHPALPEFAQRLSQLEELLVRVELLPGAHLQHPPGEARIFLAGQESNGSLGKFVSEAPAVDPLSQAQAFFYLAPNAPGLRPGAAVTARLALEGEKEAGVIVPRAALLRNEGKTWVYIEEKEGVFERREVESSAPLEAGWFAKEGFKAGEKAVVAGAAELWSEEIKARLEGE